MEPIPSNQVPPKVLDLPSIYAQAILIKLSEIDPHTGKAALRIAEVMLDHRYRCEVALGLGRLSEIGALAAASQAEDEASAP